MRKERIPSGPRHEKAHASTNCAFCRNFHDFRLPDHLLDQLTGGNVVLFAGAGISTEVSTVFPVTFYQEVHAALGLERKDRPSFPALMSMFCGQADGRRKLLEKLRSRFSYIAAFPELLRAATRFHREISTLFHIDTYVTTNWDDYFERYCGATPFVTAEDFAFWNTGGRKVFKIHGSVSSYGSIVATAEDYRRAQKELERGSLGSALKLLLATKTILYAGYSFSDPDFLRIQRYIKRELRAVAPAAYIVSVDRAAESRLRALGLIPIFTDAAYFIQVLKKHLERDGCLLPDGRLSGVRSMLARLNKEHARLFDHFQLKQKPEILFASLYQDGLAHAFERMIAMAHTGQYSHRCELAGQLRKYATSQKQKLSRGRYDDVAYIEGYMNGILYLLLDDRERKGIPLYFGFGMPDIRTFYRYKAALARGSHHKTAISFAKRRAAKGLGPNDVLHHTPFLD